MAAGPLLAADPEVDVVLRERRAETEEGRYQPEDWPGQDERPRLSLRVTSPVDLAAAVAGAEAVVAAGGPMIALAWALGVPHVAIAPEGSPADAFVAWTGDASALLEEPKELLNATDHIFARRGRPPGLKRLEATVDQSLDEAAAALGRAVEEKAAVAPARASGGSGSDQERPGVSTSSKLSTTPSANVWRLSGCASGNGRPCSRRRPTPPSSRPSRRSTGRTS